MSNSNPSYLTDVATLEKIVEDMKRRGVEKFYVRVPSGHGERMTIYQDGVPSVVFVAVKGVYADYALTCDLTGDGSKAHIQTTEAL